jgi:periplasmic protein TonB
VHLSVLALAAGGYHTAQKTIPAEDVIKLKIMLQPVVSPPAQPIPTAPPPPKRVTEKPAPIQSVPPKKVIPTPETVKSIPSQAVTIPVSAPVQTPVPIKAPETPKISAQKAPPAPPPPPKENYEEENLGRIRTILAERLKYPKNAARLNQQGEVTVLFTLTPEREVTQLAILHSSDFELLDNAARTLIETSASEFPKPSKTVRIAVPIDYHLR